MSKPNNPPAFPNRKGPYQVPQNGMTLRDYFAAKAMAAFLSRATWSADEKTTASLSYSQSDAMLEERAK